MPWYDWLLLIAVAGALAIVPLVVYLKVVPLSPELYPYWNGQPANFDFFSYYKARILIGLAAPALAGLVAELARSDSALRRLPRAAGVLLAGYAAAIVASTWTSPFPSVALDGFPDRYEGALVLFSYLVLALASFTVFTTAARVRFAIACLAASAIVVGFIGLLQYAGVDPFRSAWGQRLILPAGYAQATLQFPIETRPVYSTLFHYNYVGSYTALVLPFLVALLVRRPGVAGRVALSDRGGATLSGRSRPTVPRLRSQGIWRASARHAEAPGGAKAAGPRLNTLVGAAAAITGLVWLVSGSRAGLTGGALGFAVLAVGLRSRVRVRWTVLAAGAGALMLVLIAADLATGGRVRVRAASIASDFRVLFARASDPIPPLPIEIVRIDPAAIHLKTPNGALLVRYERGNLSIFDEQRQQPLAVTAVPQTNRIRIDDARFSHFVCTLGRIGGQPAFVMRQGDYVLNFLLLDSGIRLALKTGRPLSLEKVETFGFTGREALGSARGYIWSRSLPLLRHTLFLGFGPDTFAMVFPQQDLTGKFRVYGTTDMLVDKVHNAFLQTALSTGVLSALLLAAFFLWYIATSARIYFGSDATDAGRVVGLACCAGVIGSLGAGLFNDSIVGVAPVFWALLGLGIRMNVQSTRQEDFSRALRR